MAGVYFGLGTSGRTLFCSIVFTLDILVLIQEFNLDVKDVFMASFMLSFTLMGIGG